MIENQRDVTDFKNLALWKEGKNYVIRKGFGRNGCYIDQLNKKDLIDLGFLLVGELNKINNIKLCKTTGAKIATIDGKKIGLKNVPTATKKKLK